MFDPISLGVMGGASLLGAGVNLIGAKQAQKEQARREKYNQMMSALDTRYRTFGSAPQQRLAEMDAPTTFGAVAKGALGGLQQGANIYGMLQNSNLADEFLKTQREKQAAQALGGNINTISNNMGMNAYSQIPRNYT